VEPERYVTTNLAPAVYPVPTITTGEALTRAAAGLVAGAEADPKMIPPTPKPIAVWPANRMRASEAYRIPVSIEKLRSTVERWGTTNRTGVARIPTRDVNVHVPGASLTW
jgi:hypothetical protein